MELMESASVDAIRPDEPVGMDHLPEGWVAKPLDELFDFFGGHTASRAQLSAEGHCYLHYGDIHLATKSYIDVPAESASLPRLNIAITEVSKGSLLGDGDVVFVDASEDDDGVSKHVVIDNPVGLPFISGLHTIVAKAKTDELDVKYRRYCFQTAAIRDQFRFYAVGTKVSGISKTSIRKVLLAFPKDTTEQRAIARALSDADALLSSLEQLIAKKKDIKRGAMQALLTPPGQPGHKRLPGFTGEWEVKRFESLAKPRKERVTPSVEETQHFCIELEHIESGTGRLVGSTWTSPSSSQKTRFLPGDVLFGKLRAYLRKYWLADREGVCSTEIWALQPNHAHVLSEFLKQLVMTPSFIEVASMGFGTHMPRTDWKLVREIEVTIPDTEEQAAIATVLSDMDSELIALEAKLEKLRKVKQGMMQELLTGRKRLV